MRRVADLRDGSLAQRITAAPVLSVPHEADARIGDWLGGIADTPAGKTLRRLCRVQPTLGALMMGLAEASPYLWELMRAEPERLVVLLETDPERRFDDILAEATRAIAATHDDGEVMRQLRRMKAEAALLIALADIGGVWPVTQVIDLQTRL